jgi:hypothetical protein
MLKGNFSNNEVRSYSTKLDWICDVLETLGYTIEVQEIRTHFPPSEPYK